MIFSHINLNSLRNKFEIFQEIIGNNIDVLLIPETKLGALFSSSQFIPPYRLDRMQHGGGTMLLIRQDIPSKLLNADTSISGIKNLLVEINLRSISGSYNPHLNSIQNHLVKLRKKFDFYFIVLGDFNAEITNAHMEEVYSYIN